VSRRQGEFPGSAGAFLPTFLRQRSDEGSRYTLDAFLSLCGRAPNARCAFSAGSPAATRAKFAALLRRLRFGATPTDRAYADFVSEAIGGLYLTQNWGKLGSTMQKMWTSVSDSPAAWSHSLLTLSEPAAAGLPEDATSATGSTAQYASLGQTDGIVCGESPNPKPAALPRIDAFAVNRSGPVGAYWTWEVPCATWPATAAAPYDGPWDHRTANPVLVIGTTHDPATPYQNAVAMSRQLARARLLTVDGYGHSALFSPSSCTGHYETRYLIDLILPAPGTRCRGEQPFTENP
jgi:pimeloyl-ACP methyl ester carboxylesterase